MRKLSVREIIHLRDHMRRQGHLGRCLIDQNLRLLDSCRKHHPAYLIHLHQCPLDPDCKLMGSYPKEKLIN